jgi:hypothetical protein
MVELILFDLPSGKLAEFLLANPGEVPPFINEMIDEHSQVERPSSGSSKGGSNSNSNNNALAANGALHENRNTGSRCDCEAPGKNTWIFVAVVYVAICNGCC